MAIDETIMCFVRDGRVLPTIRFYGWNPPCLSIGYSQDLSVVNMGNCRKSGINIVRRITGGKAVLHNNELTYTIVAPKSFLSKSLKESFRIISDPILKTLRQFGIPVSSGDGSVSKSSSPICFQETSHYEINANGKKIAGSAQARKDGIMLQHGTILLDFDAEELCSLFNVDNYEYEVAKTKAGVTSVKHELGMEIDLNKFKSLLIENFVESLNLTLYRESLTVEETDFAINLEEKYKNV